MVGKERAQAKEKGSQAQPSKAQTSDLNTQQPQVLSAPTLKRAELEPGALSPREVQQLGRVVGNRALVNLLAQEPAQLSKHDNTHIQRDDVTTSNITETTDTGNKYTQELVLNKTKATISIDLGVNWVKKGTWTDDAAFQNFIRTVKSAAYGYLDNKFKVVCTPKATGAGTSNIELPINFLIYDIDTGYQIEAVGGKPGGDCYMSTTAGKLFEYDSSDDLEEAVTFAHEFGHAILGASDEYKNPKVPGRVLTNDHSIMANYYTQGKDKAEFKARHFQHIVTEVAKAFAGYTCSIKEM